MRIVTTFDPTPIPVRCFDWLAVDDDTYEPGRPVGHGETEAEAISSLVAALLDEGSPKAKAMALFLRRGKKPLAEAVALAKAEDLL